MRLLFTTRPGASRIVAVIAVAAVTLLAAYLSYSARWQEGIRDLQGDAETQLDVYSEKIFAPIDKYSYLPELVAQYEVVADALLNKQDEQRIHRANVLLEQLNAKAGSTVIYLMDPDGLTVASSNWKGKRSFVGKNYGFRPYFIDALKEGEGHFYAMGITSRAPGYYLSYLSKRNGTALGVVVVKIDLSNLPVNWGESGHQIVVTDEKGVVFLSSRDDWKYRPMSALTESDEEQLKHTRQYDDVLKTALPITFKETLRPTEQLISLARSEHQHGDGKVSYFVKSRMIPESEWTVHMFTPLDKINEHARYAAIMTIGAVALLTFLFMYFNQVRVRNRERQQSRVALEQAHQTLEEKNGELQKLNEELHVQSITDPLTGIFNRRFFMDRVGEMISSANRHHVPLSIIMIDVDHFKQINDVRGHPAGDKILQTLAALYREQMREADILARFGGEEFIIALPYTDTKAAQSMAERIRAIVMNYPFEIGGDLASVTLSIGISQHHRSEASIEETIKRADNALYQAKNNGRNKVVISE